MLNEKAQTRRGDGGGCKQRCRRRAAAPTTHTREIRQRTWLTKRSPARAGYVRKLTGAFESLVDRLGFLLCWWTRCFPSVMSSQLTRRWMQRTELLSSRCISNPRLLTGLVHSTCRRTMATRRINKAEEIEDMSPETVAKRLEIMRTLENRLPYDPWAQPVETFGELVGLTYVSSSR